MGRGRTMTVSVLSARGLPETSTKPYVALCFDNIAHHEICRTASSADGVTPAWNESFTVNMSDSVRTLLSHGHPKPKSLTFIVRNSDNELNLGEVTIPLKTLLTTGGVEGEYELVNGAGVLSVKAGVRKAKINSMLATGAAGVAAGGLLGFLAARHRRRKQRERQQWGSHGSSWNAAGVDYGYHDSSSSEEDEGGLLDWWDMDDVSSDEDEQNMFLIREGWSSSDEEEEEIYSSHSSSSSSSSSEEEEEEEEEDYDYEDDQDDDGGWSD